MCWVAKIANRTPVNGCFATEIGSQGKIFSISICLYISLYSLFYGTVAKILFADMKYVCIFAHSYKRKNKFFVSKFIAKIIKSFNIQ